jgi:ATP-dependent Clp protease adaptor protein ClpS
LLPPQYEPEDAALAESATRVDKPPLYKVLLHNDDYTTMEFVVEILRSVFNHDSARAFRIMLQVHAEGIGVAGVFTYEIAEMKVHRVMSMARESEFPLLCTMERE